MMINLDFIYPIGTIYETTSTVHPDILFGGTWELYGAGRVTVCRDTNQSEFDTIGKTGGSKYLQQHKHSWGADNGRAFVGAYGWTAVQLGSGTSFPSCDDTRTITGGVHSDVTTGNSGNLQPYIVVYRYRRVA